MPTTGLTRAPVQDSEKPEEPNIWYLAYGSNLSSKSFEGRRGIRPLARCNVVVPNLELTFDLPGIPYWEPCFANVRRTKKRDSEANGIATHCGGSSDVTVTGAATIAGASPGPPPPLTGVAYLITGEDYRKVLASEGGGLSYEVTAVECWRLTGTGTPRLPSSRSLSPLDEKDTQTRTRTGTKNRAYASDVDPDLIIVDEPLQTGIPVLRHNGHDDDDIVQDREELMGDRFIAYTLLADSKRRSAPMQPSKRYISLIRSGARENGLPSSYIAYLDSIPHYRTAGVWQKFGALLFFAMCFPIMCVVLILQKVCVDKSTGRMPGWLGSFTTAVFFVVWQAYEWVWKKTFGSGEIAERQIPLSSVNGVVKEDW